MCRGEGRSCWCRFSCSLPLNVTVPLRLHTSSYACLFCIKEKNRPLIMCSTTSPSSTTVATISDPVLPPPPGVSPSSPVYLSLLPGCLTLLPRVSLPPPPCISPSSPGVSPSFPGCPCTVSVRERICTCCGGPQPTVSHVLLCQYRGILRTVKWGCYTHGENYIKKNPEELTVTSQQKMSVPCRVHKSVDKKFLCKVYLYRLHA